jgi:hypothetical protein
MRWRWPPENSCGYLPKRAVVQPDLFQQLARALLALGRFAPMWWMTIGSISVWPMVKRGFRLA